MVYAADIFNMSIKSMFIASSLYSYMKVIAIDVMNIIFTLLKFYGATSTVSTLFAQVYGQL